MTIEIPTNEPQELVAGDRWQWTRNLSDFPASTWTLTYYLHLQSSSTNKISITASADGNTHSVDVAKGTTAAYTAGKYEWYGFVDDGTSRYRVDYGTLEILPDLTGTALDRRTHWQKVLENVEAVLQDRATKDQQSYTINGRQLNRMSMDDLLALYSRAKSEVNKEERRDRARNGQGHPGRILAKFGRAS